MSHEAAYALINAQSRLAALAGFDVMDSAPEPAFDDVVALAAGFCDAPVSTISLIDSRRQWFKARVGFAHWEAPLIESICADTLDEGGLLVINDLSVDSRTRDNPAVKGLSGLRFYARTRLETDRGEPLGTLCVIDFEPRPEGLRPGQGRALLALGRQVMAQLELRRAVTERLKQEAVYYESQARLKAVFETSYQFQSFLAPDGTLLDVNAHALKMIGRALPDVVGARFWETPWFANSLNMPKQIEAAVGKAASGETVRSEIQLDLPIGRRIFDFALRPILDEDGAVLGIVPEAVDMTDYRRMELHLRQAQKLEAVGQLTGGLAHDFNNMLGVVVGFLGLAKRRLEGKVDAIAAGYLDHAEAGVERAVALTKRLLEFTRHQPLDAQPLDVGQLVAEMSELLRHSLSQLVRLEIAPGAGLWAVRADRTQLESALLNLCINASDAMPKGGLLQIRLENVCLVQPEVDAIGVLAAGDHLLIEVKDNGTGITPSVMSRLFEPFFTTKSKGHGTGLGLSQVLSFISKSGGHMKVASRVGHGTAFRLYLPRYSGEVLPVGRDVEAPLGLSALANISVLVVDDDAQVRAMSTASLAELGCTVHAATSPDDALRRIERESDIAVLFTDIVMPGMTGPQLADRARQLKPSLKVIFTTGCQQRGGTECATPEDSLVLMKPFSLGQLARALKTACGAT